MTEPAWESLATPVGQLSVGCSEAGVAMVTYGPPPARSGRGGSPPATALAAAAARQLAEYFDRRRRHFDLAIDWSAVPGTRRRVLTVLTGSAGYGETITYGSLAIRAGVTPEGPVPPARVVGQIMGSNPYPVIVPCHRVVAGDGLGGYSGGTGIEAKRWLLIFEGSLPATLDWDPAGMSASPLSS
jgi:methylated-DNA-[protein]-cysteine S-methyltransferase